MVNENLLYIDVSTWGIDDQCIIKGGPYIVIDIDDKERPSCYVSNSSIMQTFSFIKKKVRVVGVRVNNRLLINNGLVLLGQVKFIYRIGLIATILIVRFSNNYT